MSLKPILYAEDEEDDALFVRRAFKEAGIANQLLIVPDGLAAIDYLAGSGSYANRAEYPLPCLALLDLNLPHKPGLEVLKWLRSQPGLSFLPVLMLTSSNQDADIHRAYIQGANGFLVKPGKPDELLLMVKAIRDFWLLQNHAVQACLENPSANE